VSDWWNEKPLADLSQTQWDALCDGCGKCCLHKLEDEFSGKRFYTRIRCRLLDEQSCRCSQYQRRTELVPDCINLGADITQALDWLPVTCAYRLRADNKPLAEWHPLVSGDPESVHRAGVSIRGRSISEEFVHPDGYDEHIVNWVE
jgi:uncharacterized protein